jgi:hypothetical protein
MSGLKAHPAVDMLWMMILIVICLLQDDDKLHLDHLPSSPHQLESVVERWKLTGAHASIEKRKKVGLLV